MDIKQLDNDNLRKLPNKYGDVSVMVSIPRLKMDSEHRINKKKSSRILVFIGIQNHHGERHIFSIFHLSY